MKYPSIDSVLVDLGPLAIRWYGVMYVVGMVAFYLLGKWRVSRGRSDWTVQEIADLLVYGVAGVIVGGRVGFALFYGFETFLGDPLWLFRIWEGGMSFHGGLLGVVGASWLFAHKSTRGTNPGGASDAAPRPSAGGSRLAGIFAWPVGPLSSRGRRFLEITDFAAPLAPLGLGLGRLGNFINAELPGRVTDLPIGVHFPCDSVRNLNLVCFGDYENVTRHVSSLYQASAEGLVLFVLVWLYAAKPRTAGRISAVFLIGYGCLRFLAEFAREPDPDKGFVLFDWMTMGQLLSLPMVAFGLILLFLRPPQNT